MKPVWKWTIGGVLLSIGVILAVAVVVITLGIPIFLKAQQNAKRVGASALVARIHGALHSHYTVYSAYPTGSAKDVFDALDGRNPRGVRFLTVHRSPGGIPLDPWRREIVFSAGTSVMSPAVHSMGPDGIDQSCAPGSDDVR